MDCTCLRFFYFHQILTPINKEEIPIIFVSYIVDQYCWAIYYQLNGQW